MVGRKMSSHFLPRLRFYPQLFYLQLCDISRPLCEICGEDEKILESTGAVLPHLSFAPASVSATYFGNTHSQIGWKVMQIDTLPPLEKS